MGRTPLHRAESADAVHSLVNDGVSVHVRDRYGCTALHLAAMRGNCAAVSALLLAGSNPQDADNHGNTALHNACTADVVNSIVSGTDHRQHISRCELLDAQNHEKCTALHLACRAGRVAVAQALLDSGANANAQDRHGRTPLHYVAERGGAELTRTLIEKGAAADVADALALGMWPQRESHPNVMRVILEHCRDPVKLLSGAQVLLSWGADVNARDCEGRTPLHCAGDADICSLVLKAGAVVDALDRCGRTPLHVASGEPKVRMLCLYGAKVNRLDREGNTALDLALASDRPLVVDELLKFGALRAAQLKHGMVPALCRRLSLFVAGAFAVYRIAHPW